jgi:hypothetical protein
VCDFAKITIYPNKSADDFSFFLYIYLFIVKKKKKKSSWRREEGNGDGPILFFMLLQ